MSSALPQKDVNRLLNHLEDHGCEVIRRTRGWVIRFPGGGMTAVHYGFGDRRAFLNLRATLKNANIPWPWDKHKTHPKKQEIANEENTMSTALAAPDQYTTSTPGQETLDTVKKALDELTAEGVERFTASIIAAKTGKWKTDYNTIYRSLTALGYVVADPNKKTNREWIKKPRRGRPAGNGKRPDLAMAKDRRERGVREEQVESIRAESEASKEKEANAVVEEINQLVDEGQGDENRPAEQPEVQTVEEVEQEVIGEMEPTPMFNEDEKPGTAPAVETVPEERIVMDSYDSWTLDNVDTALSIDQLSSMARSLGLEVEVRVWRRR